jgi:predicted HicB family RNase H-like nuclease
VRLALVGYCEYWARALVSQVVSFKGTYLSTAKRDPNQSKSGKAPTFQTRITPELKAQFEAAAKAEGMRPGNWIKTLGRKEIKRLSIEPQDN